MISSEFIINYWNTIASHRCHIPSLERKYLTSGNGRVKCRIFSTLLFSIAFQFPKNSIFYWYFLEYWQFRQLKAPLITLYKLSMLLENNQFQQLKCKMLILASIEVDRWWIPHRGRLVGPVADHLPGADRGGPDTGQLRSVADDVLQGGKAVHWIQKGCGPHSLVLRNQTLQYQKVS